MCSLLGVLELAPGASLEACLATLDALPLLARWLVLRLERECGQAAGTSSEVGPARAPAVLAA